MSDRVVDAHGLFGGLLDDAAIFPPGNAPAGEALRAYARSRRSADARYISSFICSSPRLGELTDALPDELSHLDLSLVVPDGAEGLEPALAAVAADERLILRAVELPVRQAGVPLTIDSLVGLPPGVLAYVEPELEHGVGEAAVAVAQTGHRVKLRTGGTVATAFPSEETLAAGLIACEHAGVPFKLTAGLHNAVRHRDPATGFEHHGFLNVLLAVASALDGGRVRELAAVLAERDAAVLAERARNLPDSQADRVRRRFVSFGTCSTQEPLTELRTLGLIPKESA